MASCNDTGATTWQICSRSSVSRDEKGLSTNKNNMNCENVFYPFPVSPVEAWEVLEMDKRCPRIPVRNQAHVWCKGFRMLGPGGRRCGKWTKDPWLPCQKSVWDVFKSFYLLDLQAVQRGYLVEERFKLWQAFEYLCQIRNNDATPIL